MTSNFFASLKSASDKLTEQRESKGKASSFKLGQSIDVVNPGVSIENGRPDNSPNINFILNRQRIDVLFAEKPSEYILQSLRDAGFHYRPSDKAWYHADYQENRDFLKRLFDLTGEDFPPEEVENRPQGLGVGAIPLSALIPDSPKPEPVLAGIIEAKPKPLPVGQAIDRFPNVKVDAPIDTLIELPEFEVYKSQCDKLVAHYGLDFADLALMAVDKLFQATFK